MNQEFAKAHEGTGERFEVRSGAVLIIDQFMLANPQFTEPLQELFSSVDLGEVSDELRALAKRYGGCVLPLPEAVYRAQRDPYKRIVVLFPVDGDFEAVLEEDEEGALQDLLDSEFSDDATGRLFIDTRCFVVCDIDVLRDGAMLSEFRSLRQRGEEKSGRDLLREKGAMVRYGFQRFGDELGVYLNRDRTLAALWPDVTDD